MSIFAHAPTTDVRPLAGEELLLAGRSVWPERLTVESEAGTKKVEAHSMAVLDVLAREPGRVVSRDELIDRVWEGQAVGDHALTHAIWDLRRALGDDPAAPCFIETIPRRGYRLCCDATWREARASSSASSRAATSPARSDRRVILSLSAVGLIALMGLLGPVRPNGGMPGDRGLDRLTQTAGEELYPSLSKDGEILVFAARREGVWDIFLRPTAGGRPLNLTGNHAADDTQPALSPDGRWIAFRSEREGGGLFVMDLAGESVWKLTEGGWNPSWSPDGEWIAFATESAPGPLHRYGRSEIHVVEVATGETRRVWEGDGVRPEWSPHGHRLAFWSSQGSQRDILTVGLDGRPPVAVTDDEAMDWDPAWSAQGELLYFFSERAGSPGLWRVAIDERSGASRGPPEPVALGLGPTLAHLRLSCRGRCAVFTALETRSRIDTVPWDPVGQEVRAAVLPATGGLLRAAMPAISPDGRWIAFSLGSPGDIAIVRSDGSELRQLTDSPYRDVWPRVSPDGRTVAYASNRDGDLEIWAVDVNGGPPRRLTDLPDGTLNAPVWSPTGDEMAAASVDTRRAYRFDPHKDHRSQTLEALPPFDGGDLFVPWSWSPDGGRLAGILIPPGPWPEESHELAIYSLSTGRYTRLPSRGSDPCWLADGRRLLVYNRDGGLFELLDTVSGVVAPVFRKPQDQVGLGYWLPRDDRRITFASIHREADLWLLLLESEGATGAAWSGLR